MLVAIDDADKAALDVIFSLSHRRTCWIAGLSLSPDGNHLLSNSMDNNVMMWDVRPFANQNRLEKTFRGIKVMLATMLATWPAALVFSPVFIVAEDVRGQRMAKLPCLQTRRLKKWNRY